MPSLKTPRVIINGAHGLLGQIAVHAVNTDPKLNLVAELGRGDNLRQAILDTQADIVLELTQADVVCPMDHLIRSSPYYWCFWFK
jgi:dihydrodipicolinate reductase